MSELFFVLKCLVWTAILTVALQIKVGGMSLEARAENWLERSEASIYVQSVAAGGALAISNFAHSVKNGVSGSVDSYKEGAREQKAGR